MSEQLEIVTFADLMGQGILEIGDGYRAKLEELGGDGPFFLRAGLLIDQGFEWASAERFHSDFFPKMRSKLGQPGDTMVTTKGNSVGRTAYVPPGTPEFVYSPHLSYWRSADSSRLSSGFLRYWSKSPEFSLQLKSMAYGTDMAPYLSLADQRRLRISLPSISIQEAIAEILGSLDDKIAINGRISSNSRNLAVAVGQKMFYECQGDDVHLRDYAEIVKGTSYRSVDIVEGADGLVSLKCVGRDGEFNSDGIKPYRGECKPAQIIEEGDIVVAQTDLTQKAEVIGRPVRASNLIGFRRLVASLDLIIVRPRNPLSREMLFALLSTERFHDHAFAYCNGTTVLHLGARALPEYGFVMPGPDGIANATEVMRPLLDKSDQARREIQILTDLRDALLPKLISGDIQVHAAEKVVEEAT